MITRSELAAYLQDFLSCEGYSDYAPNGLQVEGNAAIKRICTAVTASEDAISKAITGQADALLVHHGYFWRGENPVISGMKRQRLQKLLSHQINLFAYHLPLDCHPELGNNACIANLLDVELIQMHKVGNTENLMWSGKLPKSMESKQFSLLLQKKFQRAPLSIVAHNRPVTQIAWCSGAAQDFIADAVRLGVDAFISGEVSERTWYEARESGINYYACGHHATERLGIQALGNHLSNFFKVDHFFIDSDNPV